MYIDAIQEWREILNILLLNLWSWTAYSQLDLINHLPVNDWCNGKNEHF
jgi:hypothetical protein